MKKKHVILFFVTLSFCTLHAQAIGFTYLEDMLFASQVQLFLQFKLFQIQIWKWLGLLFGLTVNRFFIRYLLKVIIRYIKRFTEKTKTEWDDLIFERLEPSSRMFLGCLFWFLWIHLLNIEGSALTFFLFIIQIFFSFAIFIGFYRLIDVAVKFLMKWMSDRSFLFGQQMEITLKRLLKILVVILGVLMTLQNLGVNVLSVMAGLGLGGLAFALAAKDMCAHFFGSIMIFLDQPFKVGDWVVIGDVEGNIEDIGFRSTRIRTFYDSVVTIPNGKLSGINIDNMGRRKLRRMKAFYSLTYDTPSQKIKSFIEGIKQIIKSHPHTDKNNFHVVFKDYKDSSLDIMLYCFFEVSDWGVELVSQQDVHLEILELAEKLGIDFAFPTRTLHINQPAIDGKA